MHNYIKIILVLNFVSTLSCCNSKRQENHQKGAAYFVNSIDSLTKPLGPPANNLIAYFQKINAIAKTTENNRLPEKLTDSLKYYYRTLITNYENAIQSTTILNPVNGSDSLKKSFLILLKNAKEPWTITIPVYLKLYNEGWNSISDSDQNIIKTSGSIYNNAAKTTFELENIIGDQEELLIKLYHLKLYNNRYR